MDVVIEEREGRAIVVLRGDVDMENAPSARRALLDCVGSRGTVLVDLSGVDYLDSSGVASLVEALQAARKRGSAFGLAAVSVASRRVLELGRLDRVFAIYESVEAGLDALG